MQQEERLPEFVRGAIGIGSALILALYDSVLELQFGCCNSIKVGVLLSVQLPSLQEPYLLDNFMNAELNTL